MCPKASLSLRLSHGIVGSQALDFFLRTPGATHRHRAPTRLGAFVCVLTYGDKASRQKEHRSPLTEQLEQSLGAGYGGVSHVTRPLTPGETQAQQALVLCPGHRLPSNKVAHSV